ncbi:thioesterase-like superfamily domain-containing protein [Pochonia chlamydosporia 170]|uniref:Thioesterase-like superfamily domain-containing protein n=1 Tax=Pochonia chlamydosporia 170 TaxID=1380566 RepID=A0A179FJW3_METCM|nr:thioesterase-like superfamily domain-containing protein [Pochonia chlamydosporia 170]OAQ65896.1 thioesterase-like superfamily domain-containing protein [Pochonia chlamydosporia 170]
MENAHIPNSHSDVTPSWRPFKFERTPLKEAIKTTRVQGTQTSRYAGTVPKAWCSRSGRTLSAHGGYCGSVLVATSLQYFQDAYGDQSYTTPLSLSVEFLRPLPEGPYEVAIHDYAVKGNIATIRAEITSPQPDTSTIYSVGVIRLRRNAPFQGGKSIQAKTAPFPDRVRDCARWTDGLFYHFNPPAAYLRTFAPKGEGFPLWSEKFGGQNQRWQWVKLDYEEKFELLHLPVLSDLIPVLPLNFEKDGLLAATRYQIATLSLHLEFRTPEVDEEWLISRTTMNKLQDGVFDMGIQIMNNQGDIIATCTQNWSMTPRKTRQIGSGESKL